jgi:hypothetical protein
MDSNLLNPPASTSSSSSSSSQPTIGGIKSQQQQQQQTSTPYNDTIGKKPGLNVSYSSPSNQSCLTDNKHLANVITLNGSEISFKAVNSANKNVLAANINISNVSSGSLLAMGGGGAGGHNNSTNGSSNHRLSENSNNPDVVSYQRIKKVVIETSTSTASQVKLKEDQLRHLQSIDLNKYSFPNE